MFLVLQSRTESQMNTVLDSSLMPNQFLVDARFTKSLTSLLLSSHGFANKELEDLLLVDRLSWPLAQLFDKVAHGRKLLLGKLFIHLRFGHLTYDELVKSRLCVASA